jgi:pimeloyl-ACP methyl ester carboxylesterase
MHPTAVAELERRGMQAVVPSLLATADAPPPQWQQCVEIVRAATRMVPSPIVLVGHSGGGLLLPAMAGAVAPDVSRFIFVDSGLPATTGETPLAQPRFFAPRQLTGAPLRPSVDVQVIGERLVGAEGIGAMHPDGVPATVEQLEHHEEAIHDRCLRRACDAGIDDLQDRC